MKTCRALVSRSVSAQSTVFLPWGDGSATIPLVGAVDVSHVAAALLTNPESPSARAYDLIAAIPTVKEIVDTLSAVLQRPIRYVDITDEQWADAVRGHLNPHALNHLSHLWRYFRSPERRNDEDARNVTDTIPTITARRAQTLEDFFKANERRIRRSSRCNLNCRLGRLINALRVIGHRSDGVDEPYADLPRWRFAFVERSGLMSRGLASSMPLRVE